MDVGDQLEEEHDVHAGHEHTGHQVQEVFNGIDIFQDHDRLGAGDSSKFEGRRTRSWLKDDFCVRLVNLS